MAERERYYNWFVEAFDSHTNEVIAKNLENGQGIGGEFVCADGEERFLWRCDAKFATNLRLSKTDLHLHFQIFVQEGNGKIRLWPFQKRRSYCRIPQVTRITQKTG